MIKVNLPVLLAKRGWKQSDLVKATGLRPNDISDKAHGTAERIHLKKLGLICEALDCNVGDIFEYAPKTEADQKSSQAFKMDNPYIIKAIETIVDNHLRRLGFAIKREV